MSSLSSFKLSSDSSSIFVPLVTQLSNTMSPINILGSQHSSDEKTNAERSPVVALNYRRSQTTSMPWTSFTPPLCNEFSSPELSEIIDSDGGKSLPTCYLNPGSFRPTTNDDNWIISPAVDNSSIEEVTHKADTKSQFSVSNMLRPFKWSFLTKKPPTPKIPKSSSVKRLFYPKRFCSFPKRRPVDVKSQLNSQMRPSSTQPTKSSPLKSCSNLVNSASQPTLIVCASPLAINDSDLTKNMNNTSVTTGMVRPPPSESTTPESYNTTTIELNPPPVVMSKTITQTGDYSDKELVDLFTESNKRSQEIGWFPNPAIASCNSPIPFASAKVVTAIQQRLCEEYHELEERNQKLTARFKAIEATNIHYKRILWELEESNAYLQKENSRFLHTNIKHQFLKLETSDLSKKADSVKIKLVNKEKVVSEFKHQYDELNLIKEDVNKGKEVAFIEAQHNRNKLSELSEVAKELDILRNEDVLRKQYFNRLQLAQGDVRVFLHLKATNEESCITFLSNNKVMLTKEKRRSFFPTNSVPAKKEFTFSRVFQSSEQTEEIFEEILPLAETVIDGYNASIITYGQTGSGKTYTMFGNKQHNTGIAHRLIWKILESCHESSHWKYSVIMTVIELYRKRVFDLIRCREVKLEDDGNRVILRETEEIVLDSEAEVSVILEQINLRRHSAISRLNAESSRGHVIVIVRVQGHNRLDKTELSQGALMLCDTAGFDCNSSVKQNKIDKHIQFSLSALGSVLSAKKQNQSNVNYSNTTLTQIMRPCLSNEAKCCVLVSCHSDLDHYASTMQAMQFGSSALASPDNKPNVGPVWNFGKGTVSEANDTNK